MLSASLIIFREIIEISIIISVIYSSIEEYNKKNIVILKGVAIGLFFSIIFAVFMDRITESFDGMGQEIINSIIMISAICLITYSITWMKSNVTQFSNNLKQAALKEESNKIPKLSIILIIATSFIREGTEIILFSYGVLSSSQISKYSFFLGAALGLCAAVLVVISLNFGLMKTKTKQIFSATTILLILIASSMSAQVANNLISMGLFDSLSSELWDSSWLISDTSILGQILNAFMGYVSKPNTLEILFYFGTLTILVTLNFLKSITFQSNFN